MIVRVRRGQFWFRFEAREKWATLPELASEVRRQFGPRAQWELRP